jgi:recombination protein RecA
MSELDKVIKDLNKKFGNDYAKYGLYKDYERISFGVLAIDFASGGGFPKSKVVTLAGKYSAGKTTTSMNVIAQFQKNGGKVALIDTEGGFDPVWASKFGVNVEELLVARPETIEEVGDTIEPLLATGELDLIVFDSVASTPSKKELEASVDQKSMGGIAKEVGLLMRKITARLRDVKTSVLIINQLRDSIAGWGSAEYMPGGTQLKNQSDIIIWMRKGNWIGKVEEPEGIEVNFRINKNRTAPPLRKGTFELYFDGRINNNKTLIVEAVKLGIIEKGGAWYKYKEEKYQGISSLIEALTDEDLENIKKETLEKYEKQT